MPLVFYGYDPALRCNTRQVVGYVARCSCGWKGGRRDTVKAARVDHADHLSAVALGDV